jgi:predicted RNase H-like HicB family nuclease
LPFISGGVVAERNRIRVEIDREIDGRWIAEIPSLPGVLAYGRTRAESVNRACSLATAIFAAGHDTESFEKRVFAISADTAPKICIALSHPNRTKRG